MTKIGKVPFTGSAGSVKGGRGGTAQGLTSPGKFAPSKVANKGQGTKTYPGVRSKAQTTGLTKAGQKSVSGGKVGKVSKG
jgi:hypothetical protein